MITHFVPVILTDARNHSYTTVLILWTCPRNLWKLKFPAIRCYSFGCRGEGGELASKKDFINTARLIAKESDEVVKMAKKVAEACTDKRMKRVNPH